MFVDTAPVMEKPLAARAGLGWQGKHTNLVSREFGSWLFIGSIFTTAEIAPDAPEQDHCGACRRCLDVCPTRRLHRALPHRCARLHLLPHHRAQGAHRAAIPRGDGQPHLRLRRLPRRLPVEQIRARRARGEARASGRRATTRRSPSCCVLDDAAFRARFRGTPIKRTGRDRFLRNVLIAAGNSGDAALVAAGRGAARRRLAAGARHGGMGAVAAGAAALPGVARRATPTIPIPPCEASGWERRHEPAVLPSDSASPRRRWRSGSPPRAGRSPEPRATWARSAILPSAATRSPSTPARPATARFPRRCTAPRICCIRSRRGRKAIRCSSITASRSRELSLAANGSAISRRSASMAIRRALGRRDDGAQAQQRADRGAGRGRAGLARIRPRRPACRCRSSGSPAFMVPAAACSTS